MQYQFTPGAQRALADAGNWIVDADCSELDTPALLMGLLAEAECRAAAILARHGILQGEVCRHWPALQRTEAPASAATIPPERFSADVELSLQAARQRLADYDQPLVLATEHLLLGLVAAEHDAARWLRRRGLDPDTLEDEIHRLYGHSTSSPLGPPIEMPQRTVDAAEDSGKGPKLQEAAADRGDVAILRVLDAAANRAREGLRVVEDYVRFVLDDRHLTGLCKQLRHDLTAALARVPTADRLAARETQADVGTVLTTTSEQRRGDVADVLTANLTRLQESLRSLEEFGKLHDAEMAALLEQLRYRSYTLQRAVEITRDSIERLTGAQLYVLIDGCSSAAEFEQLVQSLIDAGVHVLQLRDKRLDDVALLERARRLRRLTQGTGTLFVMNDRPDLAALSDADGVHVGQEELAVKDVRTIVGPQMLIGVSTHSIDQARQAVLDGASYIGVGPTFPSGTKSFVEFPGLDLLRAVAAEIRLPAFAIGGIDLENLPEVLSAGFARVAVSGAVAASPAPAEAARQMLAVLARAELLRCEPRLRSQ